MTTVKNKLEIKNGNVIQIPGCEPISSLSSLALSRNIHCNAAVIPLADALALIPGSRVVRVMMPRGHIQTGLFFELPDGPPPDGFSCTCKLEDWYKILKDHARPPEEEKKEEFGPCSGFNFSGCVLDQDIFHITRDPDMGRT